MKFSPMLCKIGDKKDLSLKEYIFEPKLDGIRAILYKNGSKNYKLINRRNRNITGKYPEFFNFLSHIKAHSCILDGEIIVYEKGLPNFNLLQGRDQLTDKNLIASRSKKNPATYVVFDILMKDGKKLTELTLKERKRILSKTVSNSARIEKISFTTNGKRLWKIATRKHLEGVIAKKAEGKYHSGSRSSEWLKIKFLKTIDCVIIGYSQEKRKVSALALGVYSRGKLRFVGKVGTGFSQKFLNEFHPKLKKLETSTPQVPDKIQGIKWVKPKLVCEIRYLEFTKDKIMRTPAFMRLRTDKSPKSCNF